MIKLVSHVVMAAAAGWIGGLLVVMFVSGCTPAAQQKAFDTGTQTTITALKIAACVQGALAEEQLELLRQRREREAEAQIEADRLRSDMRVPSSISQEVDKVMRADAGVM